METKQRSSNQFCRCGHARSFTLQGLRHICRDPQCECVKHDTAVAPKRAKLALVEPSPNAMARDAAVALLKGALEWDMSTELRADLDAALVCLEAIS